MCICYAKTVPSLGLVLGKVWCFWICPDSSLVFKMVTWQGEGHTWHAKKPKRWEGPSAASPVALVFALACAAWSGVGWFWLLVGWFWLLVEICWFFI